MIKTNDLTKRFGSVLAVDKLCMHVRPGDIYGFVGANGSGKTTTVRMVLGLVLPTSGSVELAGQAMPRAAGAVLSRVGAIVEAPAAYGHLSGHSNLSLIDASRRSGSRRARAARVAAALERVGLDAVGRRPVKSYSLGMRQRLGLAAALLRGPELLVLDEPTNGLDPQGISEIRDLLRHLNAEGTTVFLSSHLLAEVEQLCTRIGVIDRGRLVLQDDLDRLRRPTGCTLVGTPDAATAAELLGNRVVQHLHGDRLVVREADAAGLNAFLVSNGIRVDELAVQRRSLEEIVIDATGPGGDRVAR